MIHELSEIPNIAATGYVVASGLLNYLIPIFIVVFVVSALFCMRVVTKTLGRESDMEQDFATEFKTPKGSVRRIPLSMGKISYNIGYCVCFHDDGLLLIPTFLTNVFVKKLRIPWNYLYFCDGFFFALTRNGFVMIDIGDSSRTPKSVYRNLMLQRMIGGHIIGDVASGYSIFCSTINIRKAADAAEKKLRLAIQNSRFN
jgi:hypothetical protein